MSNASDFVIENGVLIKYTGPGGNVVIPQSVTRIGSHAFYECVELSELVIPQSVTEIGSYAFYECVELSELVIPQSVTEIGERAFAGCKKLDIRLPANLKVVEEATFRDCALSSIVIPVNVTQVGKNAFLRCNKIETAGPVGGGYDYEFHWTDEIPDNAFSGLKNLKKVVLPASIKKIGKNAFKDCKELVDLTMPKSAIVSKTAFKGCAKLVEIKEPSVENTSDFSTETNPATNAVKGNNAQLPDFSIANDRLIQYNGHAAEVSIPDGITIISQRAFYRNEHITVVTIPRSVEIVEREAFCYCNKLEKIIFLGSIKKAGDLAFGWFYDKPDLELHVYSSVPLRTFTKAAQDQAFRDFCRRFSEFDSESEVFLDNLKFIGMRLKQLSAGPGGIEYVLKHEALYHSLLAAKAIPAKDTEWLVEKLQQKNFPELVIETLNYKSKLMEDPKVKESLKKAKSRAAEKDLAVEMTAADWRKIFKFSYSNGDVVIKKTKTFDEIITVPANIGSKNVRIIGEGAFSFGGDRKSPKKIIISEGINQICENAFLSVNDTEVFFPSTVTTLPKGIFTIVHNLSIHLSASVTEIDGDVAWGYSESMIKVIYAPAGSYAEQYAKEHNIPFVAE